MKIIYPDNRNEFPVWEKGTKPQLILHTGTHGNEFEVIGLVMEAVKIYETRLPDFIYVPYVSPSACHLKTRETKRGDDINRIFYSESQDPEVKINQKILANINAKLLVSFHEDPTGADYYVYDSGYSKTESRLLKQHAKYLEAKGIPLLNGIDDPEDPTLGHEFKEGYLKFYHDPKLKEEGWINEWMLKRSIVKESWLPETPGEFPISKKRLIINSFFEQAIIPYFGEAT